MTWWGLHDSRNYTSLEQRVCIREVMAEKLDDREVVSYQELLMAQMIQLDTVTQLLFQKRIITAKEFEAKLKQVQYDYESRRKW